MAWHPFKNLIKRARVLASPASPFLIASNGQVIQSQTVDVTVALHNSDIFAVINRVSSDLAACQFITDNPLLKNTLENPMGTLMNGYSVWQAVVVQMMLAGNAYVLITRDENGNPIRLEPIPDEKITATLNDDGNDIIYTVHFDDTNRSGDIEVPSSDMLHFRMVTTGQSDTQYMGVSPLTALTKEVDIQDKSNDLSLATLAHAIMPSTFIKIPFAQLDKKEKESIRSAFEQQTEGKNAGRAIVVDQSADIVTSQISPDIAKFLENTQFSQDQIAKAFCIPADYLSGKQDAQSNIEMIRAFYQSSLSGYIKPIEAELTNKFGTSVRLDVATAIDTDHSSLISTLDNMVKAGTISSEQAQKVLVGRQVFPELTQVEPVQKPTAPDATETPQSDISKSDIAATDTEKEGDESNDDQNNNDES